MAQVDIITTKLHLPL